MEFSAKDIAKLVSGEIEGDETVLINDFSKIDQRKSGTLSFLANPKYEEFISKASKIFDVKAIINNKIPFLLASA